ncbi:DUF2442 domain-containing protein [Pseudomonas sp. BN415]|uniref:DUF2442 domain-containing protein n=1 Tax=Pseudomonas sp. BN415 TaxID=2567889 RepID=UPI0024557F25|nr:DUF2442 domain-containing protein [Pseudomonas sp. BN415]MDH4582631.1 DUF2442 domain-containing protein [Pseudomonas sp. BN415]
MTSKARISSVEPIAGKHALLVVFANGKRYSIDLREHIRSFPALKPLEDLALFGTAQVGEWGFDVTWDNDLELAATTLYRLALEQAGEVMPVQAFKRWMAANKLSLTTAAVELGFTRRTITAYSSGTALIPKHVALACKGWEFEHKSKKANKTEGRKARHIA